jgi:hypothetical protein
MAAGLGFKTFNTGDVLSAADTNGYLMQGVLVFADAAARTAAITSPQEGQMSFLKDTNSTEYYSGSAWVAIGGSVPSSLEFTAGKNKIINGDFGINQRAFSSTTSSDSYGFDRWKFNYNTGTTTYSAQTFTIGTAPVAGYEGTNFARIVTTGQTAANSNALFRQFIESVRTFANQTVTVSFWAKAASGTPKIAVELGQSFGTGGSPSGEVNTYAGQSTLSTSWARYSLTVAVPSISGKTIGTNNNDALLLTMWTSAGSDLNARTGSLGLQNNTFDIWGVQIEAGSTATSFQTATGTIEGELSACQRYLPAISGLNNSFQGMATSTTQVYAPVIFAVTPRVAPTGITVSAAGHFILINGSATAGTGVSTVAFDSAGTTSATIGATITAGNPTIAANQPAFIRSNNASALILFTGCEF